MSAALVDWEPSNVGLAIQEGLEFDDGDWLHPRPPAPQGSLSIHVYRHFGIYTVNAVVCEPDGQVDSLFGQIPVDSDPKLEEVLKECRRQWSEQTLVVLGQEGPLLTKWSLTAGSTEASMVMDRVVPELAIAGRHAFRKIFYEGAKYREGTMPKIGDALSRALRERWPIRIEHDHLAIPWNLLYLGDAPVGGVALDVDCFLGIGAEILETDADMKSVTPEVRSKRRAVIHHDLDLEEGDPPAPVTQPVHAEIERVLGKPEVRTTIEEVLEGIDKDGIDFDLVYFCGHGDVDGNTLTVSLTGGRRLSPGDVFDRFTLRTVPQLPRNPIVIVNACGSARTQPSGFDNFARTFLKLKAQAVLATLADVPAATASEFSRRFVETVHGGGLDPAIAAAQIRRDLLMCHANPCGLLYAVYFPKRNWPEDGLRFDNPCGN